MRKKIIPCTALFLVLAVAALYCGYNADAFLSGTRAFSMNFIIVLHGIFEIPKARAFALLLVAADALFIGFIMVMQEYIKYKSDMRQVTPDIETPEAAGQGQYGTARWLEQSQYSERFDTVQIDVTSSVVRELIAHGYDE